GAQQGRRAVAERRAGQDRHAATRILRAAVGRTARKLMRLEVRTVAWRLRTPLHTAWGSLEVRETLHVKLSFGPGDWGEGEAAPLEPYDGVSLAAVRAALDAYAEIDAPPEELLAACAAERDLPQALAAIDLALWDRASRLAGVPIARLIASDALD